MNPFTESTLARPADGAARFWRRSAARPSARSAAPSLPRSSTRSPAQRPARLRQAALRIAVAAALPLTAGLESAWAVDVNTATQQQLESVRGIGPKTAQTIIEERTRAGEYASFEDLSERVKGIGPRKSQALQAAGLTIGQAGTSTAAAAPRDKAAAQRPRR